MAAHIPEKLRKFCYNLDFPIENELEMYRADESLLNQKLTNILASLTRFCNEHRIKFPTKYKVIMCINQCSGRRCDFAVSHVFKLAAILMNNRNLMVKDCDIKPCRYGVNCILAHPGYFKQIREHKESRWVMLPPEESEPSASPETVVASSPTKSIEFRPQSSPVESVVSPERSFAPFAFGMDLVFSLTEQALPITQPPSPAPYSEPKTYGVWDLPTIFKR